jgi:hypothetical protein
MAAAAKVDFGAFFPKVWPILSTFRELPTVENSAHLAQQ